MRAARQTRPDKQGHLKGAVAIVTGASRGIGKAIALELARHQATVVVVARTQQEGKLPGTIYSTAHEIEALGIKTLALACDVQDEDQVNTMVGRTVEQLGGINILVNNAGTGSYTPFLEMTTKEWHRVTAVNLNGTFLCTRAVAPVMAKRGGGSIVNISSSSATEVFSTAATTGGEGVPMVVGQAYGVAKAGVERLTRGLAVELGIHNISVNAVKPARPILTEALKLRLQEADHRSWATPDRLAKAVVYLAGQDARGVTGSVTTDEEILSRHGL